MSVVKKRRLFVTTSLSILLSFSPGTFNYAEDLNEQEDLQYAVANRIPFTLMDVQEMSEYREERHDTLVEFLAFSNLSTEHQELVATAMAKVYVGVPVGSFTRTTSFENLEQDGPFVSTDNLIVSVDGDVQYKNAEYRSNLYTSSPYMYIDPVPFISQTGKLLDETDSKAKFVFETDYPWVGIANLEEISGVAEKMKWVFELNIDKAKLVPASIVMRLDEPVRKRFLFKISSFRVEIQYSLIESCDIVAVSRMSTVMKGSKIFSGRMYERTERTFSNVNCEHPLQFLIPDSQKKSFHFF